MEDLTDLERLVSVVVPTYNESKTIVDLLQRLDDAVPSDGNLETVVVDDNSPDGTAKTVREYIEQQPEKGRQMVRLIIREEKRGLGSAILTGIEQARGRFIVVMDADFSHPPEVVSLLIESLVGGQWNLVVASRKVKGGGVVGWSLSRRLVSWIATKIAGGLGLGVKDPMSGFFAFDRRIIEGIDFYAIGYKILPEILLRSRSLHVKEIPYTFVNRRAGTSKLSLRVVVDYLRMSWRLYGLALRKNVSRSR